jgi:hypothetical protein
VGVLVALVGVAAVVFWPHILHGGFYLDDWPSLYRYHFLGFGRAVSVTHTYDPRPLLAYLKIAEVALFGMHTVYYHAAAVAVGLAVSILLTLVLTRLGIGLSLAGAAGLLALLLPWADSVHLWAAGSLNQVALVLYLAGLLAALHSAGREHGTRVLWHLLALILFTLSMLTYESQAALIPASGLLYLILREWRSIRWLAAVDLGFGGALAAIAYSLHSHGRGRAGVAGAWRDLGSLLRELGVLAAQAIDPFTSHPVLVVAGLGALTLAWAGWLRDRRALPRSARPLAVALLLAGGFSVLAALPLAGSGLHPLGPGFQNRANVAIVAPVAILVVLAVQLIGVVWVRPVAVRAALVGLVLVAIAADYSVRLRDDISRWDQAALIQHRILRDAQGLVSHPAPRSTMLVTGYPAMTAPGIPTLSQSWDLGAALSLLYRIPIRGLPLFGSARLRCTGRGVYPVSAPGPYDALQGGEDSRLLTPYGRAVLLDAASRTVQPLAARSRCRRAARLLHPAPFVAGPPPAQPASSGKTAPSFVSVSASSAAGSESRTIPHPANRRAAFPRSRAQRRATENSPSPLGSVQPTAPAYQPRSKPSSAGINRTACSRGSPPTAGVGCSSPASSITGQGEAS